MNTLTSLNTQGFLVIKPFPVNFVAHLATFGTLEFLPEVVEEGFENKNCNYKTSACALSGYKIYISLKMRQTYLKE